MDVSLTTGVAGFAATPRLTAFIPATVGTSADASLPQATLDYSPSAIVDLSAAGLLAAAGDSQSGNDGSLLQQSLSDIAATDQGSGTTPYASLLINGVLGASPTVSPDALTAASLADATLETAIAANPDNAAALVSQATSALAAQATAFENQLATSTQSQDNAALLTAAAVLPVGESSSLTSDVLLLQAGLASASPLLDTTSPLEDLLAASQPAVQLPTTTVPAAAAAANAASQQNSAAGAPSTQATTTAQLATSLADNQTTAQELAATTATPSDSATADLLASQATQALQNLLSDPVAQTQSILDTPLYAALIASSHLGDFVQPAQATTRAPTASDSPAPVSATSRARYIAYYNQQLENEGQNQRVQQVLS